jgi:hypothetical protein
MLFESIANSDLFVFIIIIFLLVVSMMMVYLVYSQNKQLTEELMLRDKKNREANENKELDLRQLTKELEQAPKEKNIELTNYEAEQEEKAIISYEELVANQAQNINYSDFDEADDIVVKKVDLENTGPLNINEIKEVIKEAKEPVSYAHEEEVLHNLKQIQSLLN